MGMRACLVVAAILAAAHGNDIAGGDSSSANPIRRVVSMLQSMAKKVETEAAEETALYDKFACYCKTSGSDLSKSISENTAKVPQVQSEIDAAVAAKAQAEEELKAHQAGRTAAKASAAEATALRQKEAEAFAKESSDLKSNIGALSKAIPMIEKGMAGGFLQTSTASLLRRVAAADVDLIDSDRDVLTAFLSGSSATTSGYVPSSGQITGILKQMQDEFEKDLAGVVATESEAKANYELLVAALAKEIAANTKAIERKTKLVGELGVNIANMKNDLSDAQDALIEDQKFLQDLEANCGTKAKDWEERKKTRAEELLAIHETIKILNDDDALELFKQTLPSPSLLQVRARVDQVRRHALAIVKGVQSAAELHNAQIDLIAVALTGKKVDFTSVIKMIDGLVQLLAKEQADDDNKKDYCGKQLDETEDKVKNLKHQIDDLETSIAARDEKVQSLVSEIKTTEEGIKALDKQVAEATEQRKKENVDFSELMSSDSAAKDVLAFAKNRLQKFYNPKLYKAAPKRELSEQIQIASKVGAVFIQIEAHQNANRDAPQPPPETYGAYSKKSEETGGVLAMIDLLVKDLDKEMTEAQTMEEDAQKEYEQMMSDAAAKRAGDTKALNEDKKTKADVETMREGDVEEKASQTKEFLAAGEYGQQLHAECDWLLQNHDLRKQARADEADALKRAKAVLSGADFSLLQKSKRA